MQMKTKGFRPYKTIIERLKLMKNDSFHQSMIAFYMSESDMTERSNFVAVTNEFISRLGS